MADAIKLVFKPETLSWRATGEQGFEFELPEEFRSETEAVQYFKNNRKKLLEIENSIVEGLGKKGYSETNNTVFIENTKERFVGR